MRQLQNFGQGGSAKALRQRLLQALAARGWGVYSPLWGVFGFRLFKFLDMLGE